MCDVLNLRTLTVYDLEHKQQVGYAIQIDLTNAVVGTKIFCKAFLSEMKQDLP